MIKHIVFDFGGVFLDLGGAPSGIPVILTKILNLPLEETRKIWAAERIPLATGKETPREFLIRMKQKLDLDFDVDQSLVAFEENHRFFKHNIDWGLVDILLKLKQKYQLHLLSDQINLSNSSTLRFAEIDQHFQVILRSYEQGFSKPDPAAFHNLLVKIQATDEPETVVFIDDIEKNIQAAQAFGIHGILYRFKDHMSLKKALAQLGVTV